jgi:hypothetical protein
MTQVSLEIGQFTYETLKCSISFGIFLSSEEAAFLKSLMSAMISLKKVNSFTICTEVDLNTSVPGTLDISPGFSGKDFSIFCLTFKKSGFDKHCGLHLDEDKFVLALNIRQHKP